MLLTAAEFGFALYAFRSNFFLFGGNLEGSSSIAVISVRQNRRESGPPFLLIFSFRLSVSFADELTSASDSIIL